MGVIINNAIVRNCVQQSKWCLSTMPRCICFSLWSASCIHLFMHKFAEPSARWRVLMLLIRINMVHMLALFIYLRMYMLLSLSKNWKQSANIISSSFFLFPFWWEVSAGRICCRIQGYRAPWVYPMPLSLLPLGPLLVSFSLLEWSLLQDLPPSGLDLACYEPCSPNPACGTGKVWHSWFRQTHRPYSINKII